MYQAGAGGVAGGVVVAGLDCLGFLSRIRLCLIFGNLPSASGCASMFLSKLIHCLLCDKWFVVLLVSCLLSMSNASFADCAIFSLCNFFFTAMPANRLARFDEMPCV